jgi:hypothetical protein
MGRPVTRVIDDKASAGDPIPPKCAVIKVHVGELKQLFNSIDPSPFRNKDLDPTAEEFIVGWAKDLPRDAALALVVDLDRQAGLPDEAPSCATLSRSSLDSVRRLTDGVCPNCSAVAGQSF